MKYIRKYEKFVERNFALKSISYGLINEKIIEENSEETLLEYQDTFKKYHYIKDSKLNYFFLFIF